MAQNNCITCGDFHNSRICPTCGSRDCVADEDFTEDEDRVISDYELEDDNEKEDNTY